MRRKRISSILLAGAVCVSLLSGCGSKMCIRDSFCTLFSLPKKGNIKNIREEITENGEYERGCKKDAGTGQDVGCGITYLCGIYPKFLYG